MDEATKQQLIAAYKPKPYHVYDYCPKCNHRNDTHDMNCLECCPVKNENSRESEEPFCVGCAHKGTPKHEEPCYTCHYWNVESKNGLERKNDR